MTKLPIIILISIIATSFFFCEWNNPFSSSERNGYAFAIYFLRDETLKMENVYEKDIDQLKLSSEPWLCDKDIRFYDWSSHCIYLKEDKTHFFPNWENDTFSEFPAEWADKPFVVVANGKRCYMGFFLSALSHYWIAPEIFDGINNGYPKDIIFIDWTWLYHDYPQNNPDVKSALINAGLYHGGIGITFDTTDTTTLRMVENADTSTISYKFTITNNDKDDLYIIDPDKTGSDLFHWFTNGLTFQNIETNEIYRAQWRKHAQPSSLDYWSSDWFTKLESGQSIQRTVLLKGYPYFPSGEYQFEFKYDSQRRGMEKENREIETGRYWIGPTRSNVLVWNFEVN